MSLPHRPSLHPAALSNGSGNASGSSSAATQNRQRQYSHLNAQLAQLNANLADMENLLRMTAVQAEYVRGLGGWMGGLFMASSKILGEETIAGSMTVQDSSAVDSSNPRAESRVESDRSE